MTTDKQSDNSMVSDMNEGANKGKVNFCNFLLNKYVMFENSFFITHIFVINKKSRNYRHIINQEYFGREHIR